MITRIHSTTITVSDQEEALQFYEGVLGWKRSIDNQMGPEMRFLTVTPSPGATELVLGLASWTGSQPGGPIGVTLISDSLDADYEALSAKGVQFKGPVEEMPWGGRATWFSDPDGNDFFLHDNSY